MGRYLERIRQLEEAQGEGGYATGDRDPSGYEINEINEVTPSGGYRLKYGGDKASDAELEEIHDIVFRDGFVLLWSPVLKDLIAFVNTDADRVRVPKAYTAYGVGELEVLFSSEVTESRLRLIHEVKKHGGRVVGRGWRA